MVVFTLFGGYDMVIIHKDAISYPNKTDAEEMHLLELLCFKALSTLLQFYRGGRYYWRSNPEYPEKPPR